jgi:hypothetical protein
MEVADNSLFEKIRRTLRGHVDSATYGSLLSQGLQVSVLIHHVNQPEKKPVVLTSFGPAGDSHPDLINEANSFISSLAAYPEIVRMT